MFVPAMVVLAAVASGCSGTGASPPPPPPAGGGNPPPPPAPPPPDGIWFGALRDGATYLNDAACLIVEAGNLACFVMSPRDFEDDGPMHFDRTIAALHGNLQLDEAHEPSGTGRIYAMPGQVLADNASEVADFTVTGGAVTPLTGGPTPRRQIELNLRFLGEELLFGGSDGNTYAVPAGESPWPADGVYTGFAIHGDPASLTVDEDGALFLQTASGCAGNGNLVNVDPDRVAGTGGYNAYNVQLTLENCQELNGSYEGLAGLVERVSENFDGLVIAVFSATTAIVGTAVK